MHIICDLGLLPTNKLMALVSQWPENAQWHSFQTKGLLALFSCLSTCTEACLGSNSDSLSENPHSLPRSSP